MGVRISEPGPKPSAGGNAAMKVATDVMRMGRRRTGPARSMAARASSPRSRFWLA